MWIHVFFCCFFYNYWMWIHVVILSKVTLHSQAPTLLKSNLFFWKLIRAQQLCKNTNFILKRKNIFFGQFKKTKKHWMKNFCHCFVSPPNKLNSATSLEMRLSGHSWVGRFSFRLNVMCYYYYYILNVNNLFINFFLHHLWWKRYINQLSFCTRFSRSSTSIL